MEEVEERSEARRLPPGSHGIPADVVARNQRERLVAAMAEVCGEVGYAGATASAVAKVAGVSTVTFYKQFADKRDCLLVAHGELLGRLLAEVDRVCAGEGDAEARPRVALRIVLALLAADAPSARLLTVEILAVGPEGAERHGRMVEALAERLGTDWIRAAGALALIGDRVLAGEATGLPELEGELAAIFCLQSSHGNGGG